MLRKYGWPASSRSHIATKGKLYSAIAVLSSEGVEDVYVTDDSVNGEVFLEFVRKCMLPIVMPFDGINPNSVVAMDNPSIHHVDEVVELLTSVGVLVKFLPPYSPDLSPIEEVFAEVLFTSKQSILWTTHDLYNDCIRSI